MIALLEHGIWQLVFLTEHLGVGIALKLSPPAPPGKSLEFTKQGDDGPKIAPGHC